MRKFATESGKSKGQFYTPAEVSRIMAKVIGINKATSAETTLYDPTCGSGSLLIRAADEANADITIYGQEKDNATRGLAKMNMVLHNKASAEIMQGNTLSDPQFKAIDPVTKNTIEDEIKQFDFVVANPPFSVKNWKSGIDFEKYGRRFKVNTEKGLIMPPEKQGDYAFLLHVVHSLNATGKGAIILPHGVLFRGNAEGDIRTWLVKQGYIKAIIGLPANLFFGTNIAACILVLDKEGAGQRKSIFMIDASKGFVKDGDKNRLREQDIYKIVKTYTKPIIEPGYSRDVDVKDLVFDQKTKQISLNLSLYIESNDSEDLQDITAHLYGGIPQRDVNNLDKYWKVFPCLKDKLFSSFKDGYLKLCMPKEEIRKAIYSDADYKQYANKIDDAFEEWVEYAKPILETITDRKPKEAITDIAEKLVEVFNNIELLDKYDVYQVLMSYWLETMSDDFYSLYTSKSWKDSNEIEYFYKESKKEESRKIVGWEGKLLSKKLIIEQFLSKERDDIQKLIEHALEIDENIAQMVDDYANEDGVLFDFIEGEKVKVSEVDKAVKKKSKEHKYSSEDFEILKAFSDFNKELKTANKQIKDLKTALDESAKQKLQSLSEEEIKEIVVNKKWILTILDGIDSLYTRISHGLSNRILELAYRYEKTLSEIEHDVTKFEGEVTQHLIQLGFIKPQGNK